MNIRIVDSWLREYLITRVRPEELAEKLSLTSVSVEKVDKIEKDYVYEIEVTSNRPDLMSVLGIAREAAAILPRFGIEAKLEIPQPKKLLSNNEFPIEIISDPSIVNRITAVVMDVVIKDSPGYIKERLEASGIRSLNNLIDITNYVMRETGHPAHVFDYDRLNAKKLVIRESRRGEKIITLDKKEHILPGGDIIAVKENGDIVDLLGVMGTLNSVVNDKTKRILYFLDNNEPYHIRKTSMSLGIRSEAAVLNEKGVDPNFALTAMIRGMELFKEIAEGKAASKIYDEYQNRPKSKKISISKAKVDTMVGIDVSIKQAGKILTDLGFEVTLKDTRLEVTVPSYRLSDVSIEEDIVEEIARIYGYHNLPSVLPPLKETENYNMANDEFYWETKTKNAFKYWGFTEVYTYSMVSEDLIEGPKEEALKITNPLSEELIYMRKTLVPSLIKTSKENLDREDVKIFEIANVYLPVKKELPKEIKMVAGLIRKNNVSFFEGKGIVEQLLKELGIKEYSLTEPEKGGVGACVYVKGEHIGEIELLDNETLDFELDFEKLLKHANLKKQFKGIHKYPPVIEDLAFIIDTKFKTGEIIEEIKKQSGIIKDVTLLDTFDNTRTFHIIYQDPAKNLTSEEVAKVRNKIIEQLKRKFQAKLKD